MLNNVFEPLPPIDIQEKVEINKRDWGYDLFRFKELLEFELALIERGILKTKWEYSKGIKSYQELIVENLPSEIEAQNLTEQIRYVQNQILKEKENGNLPK